MFSQESTAILWGIISKSNTATHGGGAYNHSGDIEIWNATFVNNTADVNGGVIANNGSFPTLIHLTIGGNSALSTNGLGGGINIITDGPALGAALVSQGGLI